jgi:hypothetical protein
MINVLQIIVHMPLLDIQFPENAKFLYSLIISITKFDILPSQTIESSVFEFDEEDAINENFAYLDIFYNYDCLFLFLHFLTFDYDTQAE